MESATKFFAFIAAVSIGILTAFDLGTKSNNMTDAWRHLVAAVMRFNSEVSSKETKEAVIKAWVESEKIIGDVTYQQTGGQIRKTTDSGQSGSGQQGQSGSGQQGQSG